MGASSGCRTPRNYGVHGLFVQVCELDVRVVNPYRLNSDAAVAFTRDHRVDSGPHTVEDGPSRQRHLD